MIKPKFVIQAAADSRGRDRRVGWRWTLYEADGHLVAESTVYPAKQSCTTAVRLLMSGHFARATVEDESERVDADLPEPDRIEPTFWMWGDAGGGGGLRWELDDGEGRTVVRCVCPPGGQESCRSMLEQVRELAPFARIERGRHLHKEGPAGTG